MEFGLGPMAKDVLVLLGILFLSYTLSAFESTAWLIRLLQLGPAVWEYGFLWQIATYPLAETFNGFWFLILAWMVIQFGGQVFFAMGRKAFWRTLAIASISGGVLAVLTELVMRWIGLGALRPFLMMQGAETVLVILIAAFATLFANATVMFMFVLPIQARWFLWFEVLIAFIGFLGTKDFAGFVGLTTAVFVTYILVSGIGFKRWLREMRLRAERKLLEARLKRMQAKRRKMASRGGNAGQGGDDNVHQGPWVN